MISYVISILLYVACIIASVTSGPSWGNPLPIVCGLLIIGGFIISACISAWMKGSFKERFLKGAQWGFPASGVLYALGYTYVILETLIRSS